MPRRARKILALLSPLFAGCASIPEGLNVVTGFEPARYLGNWYEIARLDHSFERGLQQVTAEYRARDDGGITVINKGRDEQSGKWKVAEGKAYSVGDPEIGQLKVSFFGPFYGGYNVIRLAPDYAFSMVAGPSRSYLWILSRTPSLPAATLNELVAEARSLGFATESLIFVDHSTQP